MRLKILIAVFLLINSISISFGQSDSLIVKTDSLSYTLNYSKDESFTKGVSLHIENPLGLQVNFAVIIGISKDSIYRSLPNIEILKQTGKNGGCSIDYGGWDKLVDHIDKKEFTLKAGVDSQCFKSLGTYQVRFVFDWSVFGNDERYYKSYSNWFTLQVVPK